MFMQIAKVGNLSFKVLIFANAQVPVFLDNLSRYNPLHIPASDACAIRYLDGYWIEDSIFI